MRSIRLVTLDRMSLNKMTETAKQKHAKPTQKGEIELLPLNQSERKRRDRINQRLKALQKLVPNASKTDKASMLDEVINYLKQLQAQIQIMNMTNLPQMMVPLAMQQQLQMSMQLARIGAMGMVNMNHLVRPTSIMMPASLVQPRAPASSNPEPSSSGINASIPLPNPYCANLTQLVNMEILNNMSGLYRQQMSQKTQNNQSLEQQLDTNAP